MPASTKTESVKTIHLTPNEIRFYREEGYLYLPGVISPETVAALRDEVLQVLAAGNVWDGQLGQTGGAKGKLYQSGQYLRNSALDGYINSDGLRSIAGQLMEGPSTLYMPFTAVKAGGGGGTFHFHQDNQYTRFDGPGINLWLALSPMSPENGCLQVVPRSHQVGTLDGVDSPDGDGHRTVAADPTRFLPVRMNPGDLIAFTRLTIHGSGPNNTDEPRLAYAVQFHRDDVRAAWDGQPPRLLKGGNRWPAGPVDAVAAPDGKSRDGH